MSGSYNSMRDRGLLHARRLARELDTEPEHCFQVARIAERLYEATLGLHQYGKRERRLLIAAALFHDIGWGVRPEQHHKGARDLILEMELPGFSREERDAIACIARYHRKGPPKPGHRVYRDLNPRLQSVVQRLAALLRIADGLDRAHLASAKDVRVYPVGETRLRIIVSQRRASPVDIWGADRKRALFEEVFGVQVEFVADAP